MAEFQLPHDHGTSFQAASCIRRSCRWRILRLLPRCSSSSATRRACAFSGCSAIRSLRHQSGRHAGDVQPGRVAPSALPDGERPARQPPRRQGGLLPRGGHGGEPPAARDRRACHGDRLPGEDRGLPGLTGGDHRRVHTYLTEHLSERITIEALSREFLMNTTTLKSAFKRVYGSFHRAAYEAAPHGAAAARLTQTQDDTRPLPSRRL